MFTVYLVDDDRFILEELCNVIPWQDNYFEVAGYNTDPFAALEEILSLNPDVVFCDLKMPELDGNALIKKLKESGFDGEFVMISAYDSFQNVRTFFQQNGFDYILKPVRGEDVQIVLESLNTTLSKKHPPVDDEALTENPGFNHLLSYVREHFSEKITLEQLASRFGYSKNYICGMFQKYCGKSLNAYLTELRMLQARKLLQDKTVLIKEVAFRSGYTDYYHFFKVFKEYYGVSPKDMREAQV